MFYKKKEEIKGMFLDYCYIGILQYKYSVALVKTLL